MAGAADWSRPQPLRLRLEGGDREALWYGPAPADAPTLVFLHEGLGSAPQWREFPAAVGQASGCGVLAYSRLGYGRSAPLPRPLDPRFMHRAARQELPAVLSALEVREAVLVGHSDGGSIALIAAAEVAGGRRGRTRVAGVVAEAAHVVVEPGTIAGIEQFRARWEREPELRAAVSRHHRHASRLVPAWCDAWLSPRFRDWTLTPLLPRVTCPVLVVAGGRDEYGTRRQVDAILGGVGGLCDVLWLPDAGHAPHRDAPEVVRQALTRFVREVLGGEQGAP